MSQRSDDSELLKSYLLGAASDAQLGEVEDRYMADAAGSGELLLAEDVLIDDYVRGALTAVERELFERNFLHTAERRRRLEFSRGLAKSLTLAEEEEPVAARRVGPGPRGGPAGGSGISQGRLAPDSERLFGSLPEWLDPEQERAAEKYVAMHHKLTKMFALRGCANAEELADETLRRASLKAPGLSGTSNPAMYVYALAARVLREQEVFRAREPVLPAPPVARARAAEEAERTHECLERCLRLLSDGERELILQYYTLERRSKIDARRELAQRLGLSQNALRLRAHKIRTHLAQCLTSCMERLEERP